MKQYVAEFIGTLWLVLAGCGSAVMVAGYPDVGIGVLGVAFAFGLAILTMAFAIGHISGCHLNPAVSIGLCICGRFPAAKLAPYIISQVLGAIAGAGILYLIASGNPAFSVAGGFASTGYGEHSPGGYSMLAGLVCEVVMTAALLFVIMGASDHLAAKGFAPIAIGLTVTLIILATAPVTNASLNPARSTGPAIFAGGWALSQLWFFWVAPIVGGILGAVLYKSISTPAVAEPAA